MTQAARPTTPKESPAAEASRQRRAAIEQAIVSLRSVRPNPTRPLIAKRAVRILRERGIHCTQEQILAEIGTFDPQTCKEKGIRKGRQLAAAAE